MIKFSLDAPITAGCRAELIESLEAILLDIKHGSNFGILPRTWRGECWDVEDDGIDEDYGEI